MTTVATIDVGYCNTKAIIGTPQQTIQSAKQVIIPSITKVLPKNDRIHWVEEDTGEIHRVEIADRDFLVGPGITHLQSRSTQRPLHDEFCKSEQYLALYRGTLACLGHTHIDHLVAGLPVHLHQLHKGALRKSLMGKQRVNRLLSVEVQDVTILPQPIGALIDHLSTFPDRQKGRYLIVDPGGYTLDWVLAENGLPLMDRTGSFACGVFTYLKAIAEQISRAEGEQYDDLEALDLGLREGEFKLYGKSYDLTQHHRSAVTSLVDGICALRNSCGNGQDIDGLIVVGGGAKLFGPLINGLFPKNKVETLSHSVTANARGFFRHAQQSCLRSQAEAG